MTRVPIPDRMKHLDVDDRGYAVPFGVQRDADGVPHFAVNDELERQRAIRDDLCSICGTKLLRGRWLIGGPRSAFDPHGAYIDMPMHDECAHYALQTCPYLAMPRYTREVGLKKWQAASTPNSVIAIDPTMIPGRPPLFVAVMTVGQRMMQGNGFQQYVLPARPYRKIEFWRHGEHIADHEGYEEAAKNCGFTVPVLKRLAITRNAETIEKS